MKNILKLLPKFGLAILFTFMIGITLAMAYIMFAPDAWPKPFYLVYAFPPVEQAQAEAERETPTSLESETGSEPETELTEGLPTKEPPAKVVQIPPGKGLMIDTGAKIVNLVDPTGRKLLRVAIVLELQPDELSYYNMGPEEKILYVEEFNAEVNSKLPVINNILISLLSSKTYEAIYTAEGKETLRTEIMDTINTQLPEYRIIYVYFTEFVVQ